LNGRNVIAVTSPAGQQPLSDYEEDFLLKLHPSAFPHGKGKRPAGMSEIFFFRLILERVPLAQFGQNPGLTCDMWNIWQRHTVHAQSRHRVHTCPDVAEKIGKATIEDMTMALKV